MIIIDAKNLILGRMASNVAKMLMTGEEVRIINAEKTIISGKKASILNRYKSYVQRGSKEFGPYFPKRPDQIVKRTIRGMIPYKTGRGKVAFKKLRVYIGVPSDIEENKAITIENASLKNLKSAKYVLLGEISKNLGSKV